MDALFLIIMPPLLGTGGMLIAFGICRMVTRKTQENWIDLMGKIQYIDVKRHSGKHSYSVYTVYYLYEMDGAEYHKQFALNANKYAVNGELRLRVDPDNPNRHLIMSEAGNLNSGMKKLIWGIMLSVIGMVLLMWLGPLLDAKLPVMVHAIWSSIGVGFGFYATRQVWRTMGGA